MIELMDLLLIMTITNFVLTMVLYYKLWRAGTITKDDIVLILKTIAAFIPQINNPVLRNIFNELIHALMERLGLQQRHSDIDELLKRIEQLAKEAPVRE